MKNQKDFSGKRSREEGFTADRMSKKKLEEKKQNGRRKQEEIKQIAYRKRLG